MREFVPSRAAGLARLTAFAPATGRAYASGRNRDGGPESDGATSAISPYLRQRLVLEQEAALIARDARGEAAEKFIQEVFWRTYWKGFLEQHPSIWTAYVADARHGWDRLAVEAGLRQAFHAATEGRTGIACFDAWAAELVATNWLHNHTRMWFASIWIFTLRLPWALGADFFARHLLDGDPASNTLSWRWVAGLHTAGKNYVARAENIARFTGGRFDPRGELDETPEPLSELVTHATVRLVPPDPAPEGDITLLLHDDDLCGETIDLPRATVREIVGVRGSAFAQHGDADAVTRFREAALADALGRAGEHFAAPAGVVAGDLASWAAASTRPVVTAWAPLGPVARRLDGLPVTRVRRPWDEAAWPSCRRGYFQLKTKIPALLATLSR